MDNPYLQLIADEEAKVAALHQRIAECEERIRVLKLLVPRDELDDALSRMLNVSRTSTNSHAEEPSASEKSMGTLNAVVASVQLDARGPSPSPSNAAGTSGATYKDPSRKLPPAALRLLAFLDVARTREEMDAFTKDAGHAMSKSALSTFVWTYRTQYGFVKTDEQGKVVLNERGRQYLSQHHTTETLEPAGTDARVGSTQVSSLPQLEGNEREGGF